MKASLLALLLVLAPGAALPAPPLADGLDVAARPVMRPLPEPPGRPLRRPQQIASLPAAPAGEPVAAAATVDWPLRPETAAKLAPRDFTLAPLGPADDAGAAAASRPALVLPIDEAPLPAGARALATSGSEIIVPAAIRRERQAEASGRALAKADARMQPPALRLLDAWEGEAAPNRPATIALRVAQPLARMPATPPLRATTTAPRAPNAAAPQDEAAPAISIFAVAAAFRPPDRPESLVRRAAAQQAERQRGALCGAVGLQGERLGAVAGPGRCGIEDAVRVRSVAGIRLSRPIDVGCDTARAFLDWVGRSAVPVLASRGGGLARIEIMGSYSCRGRVGTSSSRLSEHSFGNAIDIGGFTLQDGSRFSVLRDWRGGSGEYLRELWRAACGPFGTVLGPNANAAHRDHFHFDTAGYRSGSYCR